MSSAYEEVAGRYRLAAVNQQAFSSFDRSSSRSRLKLQRGSFAEGRSKGTRTKIEQTRSVADRVKRRDDSR